MENKKKFILPVDETPTDQQVLGLLNGAAETMTFWNGDIDGIEFDIEALKFMQNNPHHIEGPVVNHIALMLYRLRFMKDQIDARIAKFLERAMFFGGYWQISNSQASQRKPGMTEHLIRPVMVMLRNPLKS